MHSAWHNAAVFLIGALVGFVSGLFGKGGSAIATPLLQLAGVPAFVAVAAPLPATIPGTLVASLAYLKSHLYDRRVLAWSIGAGLPLTILGARLSEFVGGRSLLLVSDSVIVVLGASFLLYPTSPEEAQPATTNSSAVYIVLLAGMVGFLSGLLANSGGVLLAPLYIRVLRLPVHTAFACSLLVSAALAIPGTAVHAWLGHIDWAVVAVFGAGSIPLAYLGARTALRMEVARLERLFGVALAVVGMGGIAEVLWRR